MNHKEDPIVYHKMVMGETEQSKGDAFDAIRYAFAFDAGLHVKKPTPQWKKDLTFENLLIILISVTCGIKLGLWIYNCLL